MPTKQVMDLVGQVYGQLKVISYVGRRKKNTYWKCKCLACGSEREYLAGNLRMGYSTQCRHCPAKQRKRKWDAPGYSAWKRISKTGEACKRWDSFEIFILDMGEPPEGEPCLLRIDPSKQYKPSNCVWSACSSVRFLTCKGRTMPLTDWAEELGISKVTLYKRLNTMSVHKALTTPAWKPKSA
jgi:hypothetical protein